MFCDLSCKDTVFTFVSNGSFYCPPYDLLISRRNNWLIAMISRIWLVWPLLLLNNRLLKRHRVTEQNSKTKDILLSYATSRMSLTVFPITFHDPIGPLFNFGHIFRANKARILHFYEEAESYKTEKSVIMLTYISLTNGRRISFLQIEHRS